MGQKQAMALTESFLRNLVGKTIALDSMIFIYLFDQNEQFVEDSERIIKLAEQGKTTVVTSTVSLLESLSPLKYQTDDHAQNTILNFFFRTLNIHVVDVNTQITLEGARLRREHKYLRTPDAIQLATALIHHADRFITNDTKLKTLSLPGLTIQTLS